MQFFHVILLCLIWVSTPFPIFSQPQEWISWIPNSPSRAAITLGDTLIFGTERGIFITSLNGDLKEQLTSTNSDLPSDIITSMVKGFNNDIWVGTTNGLVLLKVTEIENSSLTVFNTTNSPLVENYVSCLSFDSINNRLLIGTATSGIQIKSDSLWINLNTTSSNISSDLVTAISAAPNGNIIVGTKYSGISIYNGNEFKVYYDANLHNITSVFVSTNGEIWVGLGKYNSGGLYPGGGVVRYDDSAFVSTGLINDEYPSISCLGEIDGYIYAASYNNLYRFIDNNWQPILEIRSETEIIHITNTGNGNTFLATSSGVYNLEEGKFIQESGTKLPSFFITSLFTSESGLIWFGTSKGVAIYNNGEWIDNSELNNRLGNQWVHSFTEDLFGNIWIGTDSALVKFSESSIELFNGNNSSLPDNTIQTLHTDKHGNIWIGTNNGLAKYSNGNIVVFNSGNSGLKHNDINAITSDSSGTIFVGTYLGGLYRYDGITWTNFSYGNSGLNGNLVTSLAVDGENRLWIGSWNGGLNSFHNSIWIDYRNTSPWIKTNYINTIFYDKKMGLFIGPSGSAFVNILNSEATFLGPGNTSFEAFTTDTNGNLFIGTTGSVLIYKKGGVILDVADDSRAVTTFQLQQNYPNPFNPTTNIPVISANGGQYHLFVYDVLGRLVLSKSSGTQSPGKFIFNIEMKNFPSGIYFYRVLHNGNSKNGTMTLLK